jgi:subtilase family serine protease
MPSRSSRRHRGTGLLLALAGMIAGVAAAAGPAAADPTPVQPLTAGTGRPTARFELPSCATPAAGAVRCLSTWHRLAKPQSVAGQSVARAAVAAPKKGLSPADIRAAYQLPKKGAKNQTIGIVDAYDNPNVEKDLKAYRAAWKLPPCTTANKCFRKVDQRGGKKYPEGDAGWGVEIALDVQAVSAACPTCKILLVEADDPSFEAIGTAVNTAVRLRAKVVSNSYGTDEFGSMTELAKKYYTHPGVPILASSGDSGFTTASFPAVLKTTWAIGGTTLIPTKKGGWTEDAWWGAGSACSAYITKPRLQKDKNCAMRTVADISAVADSAEGFAVYDTYGLGPDNGWIGVRGTSLSAPLIAGMIGLAGNSTKVASPSYPYKHRTGLRDVVGGSNGYCGGDYLCTGVKGYDAPTGLGSPRGLKSL